MRIFFQLFFNIPNNLPSLGGRGWREGGAKGSPFCPPLPSPSPLPTGRQASKRGRESVGNFQILLVGSNLRFQISDSSIRNPCLPVPTEGEAGRWDPQSAMLLAIFPGPIIRDILSMGREAVFIRRAIGIHLRWDIDDDGFRFANAFPPVVDSMGHLD